MSVMNEVSRIPTPLGPLRDVGARRAEAPDALANLSAKEIMQAIFRQADALAASGVTFSSTETAAMRRESLL